MASINDINSGVWSLSLRAEFALVQGVEALSQGIQILLETQKGSAPMMPNFGINLQGNVGQPLATAAPNLIKEIRKQMELYHPKIKIQKIDYSGNSDGQLTINLFWTSNSIIGSNTITI